jgi:rod shape-determining protein MreC
MRISFSGRTAAMIMLGLLVGFLFWQRQSPAIRWLNNAVSTSLSPFQDWLGLGLPALRTLFTPSVDTANLQERIRSLESDVQRLQAENARLVEAASEREILAQILDYAKDNPTLQFLLADVIGSDSNQLVRVLLLNRGRQDGVQVGTPVLSANGLVGTIVEANTTSSKVLLLTNPALQINARLQTSRADGIVQGQAAGTLLLKFVSPQAKIEPGEWVFTSGTGGTYPADIPIGRVLSVTVHPYDAFQEIELQPLANFRQLEIVQVVTNFTPPNTDLLTDSTPTAP